MPAISSLYPPNAPISARLAGFFAENRLVGRICSRLHSWSEALIDHLEIKTRKLDANLKFYSDVLAPLGYSRKVDGPAQGFGDDGALDFFLVEGDPSRNVHFAFRSPDRATVDRIYEIGRDGGHRLDRAPALAPHIHPNYYAGYLLDPDGRLIEFVCHAPA
jgi:catechol 2,3-dioxygenase-like lactoylglutathione lyase family enzyme